MNHEILLAVLADALRVPAIADQVAQIQARAPVTFHVPERGDAPGISIAPPRGGMQATVKLTVAPAPDDDGAWLVALLYRGNPVSSSGPVELEGERLRPADAASYEAFVDAVGQELVRVARDVAEPRRT